MQKNDIVRLIRGVKVGKITIARNTRAKVLQDSGRFSTKVYVEVEGLHDMKVNLPKAEVIRLGRGR